MSFLKKISFFSLLLFHLLVAAQNKKIADINNSNPANVSSVIMENIYNEIIKEEIEEQKILLENKNKELEKTKKQLETKTKLAVKKWYDQEPGHTIYGYKNKNENNYNYELISIGKSKNIKNV